jgi:hypothetical protein
MAWPGGRPHDHAEALRHHARPGVVAGQQDRQLAHRAARLRRPAAALQRAVPCRRGHPGLAVPGREWRLRGRLAPADARQPFPGDDGPRLLPLLRRRVQPRQDRRCGGHQFGRTLPGRRGDKPRLGIQPAAERIRQACAGRRCRTVGDGGGLSPAPPRPRGERGGSRADGWRHDALRHPQVPPAARRARRRAAAHRRPGRRAATRHQGDEHRQDDERRRLSRRIPCGRRAHRQAGIHPGQGFVAHPRRRGRAALDGGCRPTHARPPRRRLRRRQHRAGRGAHRQAAGRHRGHHRLPPHPQPDAGA